MTILFNSERLLPDNFAGENIIRESLIYSQTIDARHPSYIALDLEQYRLEDETEFVQYGQSQIYDFFELKSKSPHTSTWDDDLTKKPSGRYKFGSIEVDLNQDLRIINRQTYSLLDWLGDIGGLTDALLIIGKLILLPYTKFKYGAFILTRFFRFKPRTVDPTLQQTQRQSYRKTLTRDV